MVLECQAKEMMTYLREMMMTVREVAGMWMMTLNYPQIWYVLFDTEQFFLNVYFSCTCRDLCWVVFIIYTLFCRMLGQLLLEETKVTGYHQPKVQVKHKFGVTTLNCQWITFSLDLMRLP